MHHRSLLLVFALSSTTAACSSVSEEVESAAHGARVRPGTGTGRLRFALRDRAGLTITARVADTNSRLDTPIDTPLEGLATGIVRYELRSRGAGVNLGVTSSARIVEDEETRVDLALATLALSETTAATVGARVPLTEGQRAWPIRLVGGSTLGGLSLTDDAPTTFALTPGRHRITYGLADGVEVDVAPSSRPMIDLTPRSGRKIARITAPERELPTDRCMAGAPFGFPVLGDPSYRMLPKACGPQNCEGDEAPTPFLLGSRASFEVGAAAFNDVTSYRLDIGLRDPVDVPLGAVGEGALELKLGRIDVDDVAVRGPSGGVTHVRGTYRVHRLVDEHGELRESPEGNILRCDASTGTGVDAPRGRYRIYVHYTLPEGGEQTETHDVDVD